MKKNTLLILFFLTLAACGQKHSSKETPTASPIEEETASPLSQLPTFPCARENFRATPVGDVFYTSAFGRDGLKKMTLGIIGDRVKFAVTDAETSCIDDILQYGIWGTFETDLKVKTSANGESEFIIENHEEFGPVGINTQLCRENDNCEFELQETGKYLIEYKFKSRDTSKILFSGKMILNSKPTYQAFYDVKKMQK